MTTSPLQFAKDFSKLKSDLALQPAADLKLLLLVDFWLVLEQHRDNKAYRSYFDEYIPLLMHLISEENLHDLTLPELQGVLNTLQSVNHVMSPDDRAQAQDKIRLTTICLAKMLFYVGCVDEGVKLCGGLAGEASTISIEYSELGGLSEYNALRLVCERFKNKRPSLYNIIKDVLDAWENERGTLSHERASCLFVEKADHGRPTSVISKDVSSVIPPKAGIQHTSPVIPAKAGIHRHRGRLRVLQGRVELFGKSATTDEITFANQIVKPDDRFIGVAYDSLEAARQVFKAEGFKDKAGAFYHAHFSIRDSTHTFTGDSIGLAVGLVTYTQLLKPEIMRQERFLSSDVAFTGGVDENGRLTPVNESSLACKVERAFFSPVKYLVLPEANLATAKEHLENLRERYPRRRLRLVGAERLSEVIENHNVIRAQKVCMGEFVVRKVYRYSRMTKVQVPLLAGLLLVLLAILFPKWTPWFPRNPEYVRLTKNGFEALNADSIALWYENYECDSLYICQSAIADLDGDGRNEVLFIPGSSSSCISDANLFVYNWKGRLLYQRDCTIMNEYPGDTLADLRYDLGRLSVMTVEGEPVIVTIVVQHNPSRSHVKLWSPAGEQRGWYINAGVSACMLSKDVTGDGREELVFQGVNVRMRSAALFVLSADSSFGVSPPYTDSIYEVQDVTRGNQSHYLLFPLSDVCKASGLLYNTFYTIVAESDKVLRVDVKETSDRDVYISYYLDNDLRVNRVDISDPFKSLRNTLVSQVILPYIAWPEFCESMRSSVLRWADSTWETEKQLRKSKKSPK